MSPNIPLGVNLPNQNLFSQITSQLTQTGVDRAKKLSEVDPMSALGNATAPLDTLWEAISERVNIRGLESLKSYVTGGTIPKPLKSSLGGSLNTKDTSTIDRILGVAKSAFILTANILVAVLEIVIWGLKGVLGLIM